MNLGRCPHCHARLNLETMIQDDAARDMLALLANLDRQAGRALVSYLSLFRSKTRDLAFDRAYRLAEETLALAPVKHLVPALVDVVEQMRRKQQSGVFKPLNDHNYLKKVLESSAGITESGNIEDLPIELLPSSSKRGNVTAAIMDIKDTDW